MSTLEGKAMHPQCRHIGACWDLLEWFQLFGTSQKSILNLKKNKKNIATSQNSISNFFVKKIKILCFHTVVLVKTIVV